MQNNFAQQADKLSQETVLAQCEPNSVPDMRKRLKYDYSEQITDINGLCSQSIDQMDQLLYQIEGV